jgi:glycosyltransferase involved in cell wall biosynthesis
LRLLYDLNAAQPGSGRYHGGAEYCKTVFRALAERIPAVRLCAFYDPAARLDPEIQQLARRHDIELLAIRSRIELQRALDSGRFDRFYSALPYEHYDLDMAGVEFFCTIHGLRPVELPTDLYEGRYRRGARARIAARVKQALPGWYSERRRREFRRLLLEVPTPRRVVIVPSEHTRYSLINQFPELAGEEIHVLYSPQKGMAEGIPAAAAADVLAELRLASRSFFLIVSANRWVKNAVRALEALDGMFQRHTSVGQRVLVLGATAAALDVRLRSRDRFVFRDYVEAPVLEVLYAEAFALVFPTLNEGFGYPPLEAMRHGTPVICSAVGPTTEVYGEAALYVNPLFGDEISTRALQLIRAAGEWNRMSELGRRHAERVARRQCVDLAALVELLVSPPDRLITAPVHDGRVSAQ